MNLSLECFSKN